jgi:glycine cleavage system H lipoate-binding protein
MSNPVDRRYSEARSWARAVGDCPVIVGIAHDAQQLPGGQVLGSVRARGANWRSVTNVV